MRLGSQLTPRLIWDAFMATVECYSFAAPIFRRRPLVSCRAALAISDVERAGAGRGADAASG